MASTLMSTEVEVESWVKTLAEASAYRIEGKVIVEAFMIKQ